MHAEIPLELFVSIPDLKRRKEQGKEHLFPSGSDAGMTKESGMKSMSHEEESSGLGLGAKSDCG